MGLFKFSKTFISGILIRSREFDCERKCFEKKLPFPEFDKKDATLSSFLAYFEST